MRTDEEWFKNIPDDYVEKLIYKKQLDEIVNRIEDEERNK